MLASAVSMDKAYMKIVLAAAGLPVLPSVTITRREWAADAQACRERAAALGYPVFVKPARGGSSIGISKVHDPAELDACDRGGAPPRPARCSSRCPPRARARSSAACSRRSTATPETSVPAEIRIGGEHEFYDFAAKYLPEEHTQLDVPADLPRRRHGGDPGARGPGVRGGRLRGAGPGRLLRAARRSLVVNEINTMPGFTPTSMFPRMWAASGVDYPALVDRLIKLALARDTGLR